LTPDKEIKVCPRCYGRGAIDLEETHHGVPMTRPCECVLARDTIRNLNRAWRGLSDAPRIGGSPLIEHTNQCAYITASTDTFRAHLRHVGIKQGRNWSFCVASDSELITAWLGSVGLSGKEILDPDAASVSMEKLTLVDLVDPPDLLIIRLGVKSARNVAMSEVFLEAIAHREHTRKPTWVVDQPGHKFNPSHLCYSEVAAEILSQWGHFPLDSDSPETGIVSVGFSEDNQIEAGAMTLSGAGHSSNTGARRVERPVPSEKPRKRNKSFKRDDS